MNAMVIVRFVLLIGRGVRGVFFFTVTRRDPCLAVDLGNVCAKERRKDWIQSFRRTVGAFPFGMVRNDLIRTL
jgi:hypothetical protein